MNLGKNKDTPNEDAASDYLKGMNCLYRYADYFTVNLYFTEYAWLAYAPAWGYGLDHDGHSVVLTLAGSCSVLYAQSQPVPLMLKVAPDLSSDDVAQIAEQVVACAFDGVIATNTTLSREAVAEHPHAMEIGGLSGQPLADRSVEVVRQLRSILPEGIALVGVGGISLVLWILLVARDTLKAGAWSLPNARQYTSFIYNGC